MYSVSLAFVIYLQVSYILTTKFNVNSFKQRQGTLLGLAASPKNTYSFIPLKKYSEFIKSELKNEVVDFAYVTPRLVEYFPTVSDFSSVVIRLTHLGKLFTYGPQIYGVSPNYQSIVFDEFNKYEHKQKENSGLTLTQQLYTVRGSQSGMISFKYYEDLLLDSQNKDSTFFIMIDYTYKNQTTSSTQFQFRPLASIISFSGFRFSKRPSRTNQPVIFSIPTFLELLGKDKIKSFDELKVSKILLKLKDYSGATISLVKQKLTKYFSEQNDKIDFYDLNDYSESLD